MLRTRIEAEKLVTELLNPDVVWLSIPTDVSDCLAFLAQGKVQYLIIEGSLDNLALLLCKQTFPSQRVMYFFVKKEGSIASTDSVLSIDRDDLDAFAKRVNGVTNELPVEDPVIVSISGIERRLLANLDRSNSIPVDYVLAEDSHDLDEYQTVEVGNVADLIDCLKSNEFDRDDTNSSTEDGVDEDILDLGDLVQEEDHILEDNVNLVDSIRDRRISLLSKLKQQQEYKEDDILSEEL